jgi:hypothetical protein
MTTKQIATLLVKILALTLILIVCFAIGAGVAALEQTNQEPVEPEAGSLLALIIVCLLETLVLTYVVLRSNWSGWKLIGSIFLVFFGVTTFMAQIESAIFVTQLPAGTLPRLFLMGAIIAGLFSPLAVLILGKYRGESTDPWNARLRMPFGNWIQNLGIIAIAYLILYFSFGYFIAWKNPAVVEYYGETDPGSFLAQMQKVIAERPWLLPFQMMRAMMWTALALPIIRMTKGEWWHAGLAVSLIFSVVMNAQLLLPNPYMPESVRMTHLIETATSNFIFGWLITWLLTRPSRQVLVEVR